MPERKKFLLRVDQKLWSEIEAWAQQELRSVNSQIEFILRESIRQRKKKQRSEDEDES